MADTKKYYSVNQLPAVLTAQHIATYLGISRTRVYELFQLIPSVGGIPNFDIGLSKRVERQDFINWIQDRKQEKVNKQAG
ncbi:hypothetical protein SPSIL_014790 [Sporomusa silvacetica DSM 10669]|uniref:Helix-turn-helix domain protein n=1 Tax=Sporomusa silvacetica DSM 10669 TaxID=1123289 RepID=A0ABZ3IIX8_9FIRM|nr:helix-turn-helix domain-containing protein [Sporomusa silvacetica]OZC21541.1 helix-turn-helix domain protein [Sporomusa silvacetica DSM 10669]